MAEQPHEPNGHATPLGVPARAQARQERPDAILSEDRQPRRRRARRLRRLLLGLVAAVGLALLILAALPDAVPVTLAHARRGPMRVTVDEDGLSRVREKHVVSAPQAGMLSRIELDPGDRVEAGDVIAHITPPVPPLLDPRTRREAEARLSAAQASYQRAQADITQARAALELSRKESQRMRFLAERGSIAPQQLDRALADERVRDSALLQTESAARAAAAEVAQARATLGRSGSAPESTWTIPVLAPVTAEVLRVGRQDAGVVTPGTPLIELGDPRAIEVVIDVLTTDAVEIEPGSPVEIVRWGGGQTLPATVRRVEPSGFTKTSTLGIEEQRVYVLIDPEGPREPWASLGDGFRVEARILTWEGRNVLSVPAAAVFREDGGWATFVVEEGRARWRQVRLGHRNDVEVEVLEGLEDGARVVLYPGDRVAAGVRVKEE